MALYLYSERTISSRINRFLLIFIKDKAKYAVEERGTFVQEWMPSDKLYNTRQEAINYIESKIFED